MKILPLLSGILLSASPAFANEILYRECTIQVATKFTTETGETAKENTEDSDLFKFDLKNQEAVSASAPKDSMAFELDNRVIRIAPPKNIGNDDISFSDLTINLDPPGTLKLSAKGQFKTGGSAEVNYNGTCKSVDASTFNKAMVKD